MVRTVRVPEPAAGLARLETCLAGVGDVAIAVSGGVDSVTLAVVAGRADGVRPVMMHAASPAVPDSATARVRDYAHREGWRLTVFDAGEFTDAAYLGNPANRCFTCKGHLYAAIRRRTEATIVSGTNSDDLTDIRPGLAAAREHGVRHPYVEACVDKDGVRRIARTVGLDDVAELPAAPCLSSRIETGIPIEARLLNFVDRAERAVRGGLDATAVRARVRAEGIVIELDPDTLHRTPAHARERLEHAVAQLAAEADLPPVVRFAPYRMGSAFLHEAGRG